MVANGQAKYFLQDHLGSTIGLTDASGNVTEQTSYDSFGNATNNLTTRYQYTGREKDEFTGLHYYRARWYDAQLGRFISEDPIGFAGGDVNLFAYVKNRPLMDKDPKGLTPSGNFWFLVDFVLGTGDQARTYQPGSPEFREFTASPGADGLRNKFYSNGCKETEFEYTTFQAAKDTYADPRYWGDTSFQVGGFRGSAHPRENNTVDFRVGNIAGANSFFLHIPPDAPDDGPFRSIWQDFHWNEPIERCKCQ